MPSVSLSIFIVIIIALFVIAIMTSIAGADPKGRAQSDAVYYLKGVNGGLEVWEDRILIGRRGFRAFLTHGCAGVKTIPMAAVQSVQFRPGGAVVNGFIQFGVLGGRERQGGVLSAATDENSVILRSGQTAIGWEIYEYIEARMLELAAQKTASAQRLSPAEELQRYKALLDDGALTQAEFDAKKRQLLGL